MRIIKKILCIMLILLLTVSVSMTGFDAASQSKLLTGTVMLSSSDGSSPHTYFYSDDYFLSSGKESDEHLRTMSAFMAFYLSGSSDDPVDTYGALLKDLGFHDIAAYDMDEITTDSIGCVIAYKTVGGVPVIAVQLRGSDYKNEWASNFQAGVSGDFSGFADSAEKVIELIKAYMLEIGMKKAKFWVTGYSRAGAVANLVGKELNERPDLYETTADDIYVYTYEAPRCTVAPVPYENIHNIIDSNDVVTQVYPAVWDAGRHGIDEEIGNLDEMMMSKRFSLSEPYIRDFRETNMSEFVSEFVDFVGINIDRQTYAESLQDHISGLIDMYYSLSETEKTAFDAFFQKFAENLQADPELSGIIGRLMFNVNYERTINSVTEFLINNLEKTAQTEGKPFGEENYNKVTEAVEPLVRALMPVVDADVVNAFQNEKGKTVYASFYHIVTFFTNISDIISHHYAGAVAEKLEAMDSFYVKREAEILGDVDGDGTANVVDATCIQRSLVNLYVMDDTAVRLADVDGDDDVTILDATWIMRYEAKMSVPEGIGKAI